MATVKWSDYDTTALRAAANRLNNCARDLSDGTQSRLKALRGELPENLEGDAEKALAQRLNDLNGDISTLLNGITGLARALNRYADELERTAQRLKSAMQG